MALFCDFENIALGVRDAKYAQFDISRVLERLLLKPATNPSTKWFINSIIAQKRTRNTSSSLLVRF